MKDAVLVTNRRKHRFQIGINFLFQTESTSVFFFDVHFFSLFVILRGLPIFQRLALGQAAVVLGIHDRQDGIVQASVCDAREVARHLLRY
jgi:hypothetical protein